MSSMGRWTNSFGELDYLCKCPDRPIPLGAQLEAVRQPQLPPLPEGSSMHDLHSLGNALTPEQRAILNEVWGYFINNNAWTPTRHIHQEYGGKQAVLSCLGDLGGSIIYQFEAGRNLFYRLTFLGILLTNDAATYEKLLVDFLSYVASKYRAEPDRTHVTSHDVENDLPFSEGDRRLLGILLDEAPMMRAGSRSTHDWNLEIPHEIEDLPDDVLAYVHAQALRDYDPQEPLLPGDKARYLQAKHPPRIGLFLPQQSLPPLSEAPYVDPDRIADLEAITTSRFDLARLIQLCRELDSCFASGSYLAVAMLARALIDHVPPIFGATTFSEVHSVSKGSRSFGESMAHLDRSCRKIADSYLHVQIRSKEALPTRTQVNFSNDIDVLLAEIVRLLR